MASSAGSDEDTTSTDKKAAPPARPAWGSVPAADPGYCAFMGGAEDWPALPGSKVTTAATAKAPASSSAATTVQQPTGAPPTSRGNLGASCSRHGAAPMPERRGPVPESSSPRHAPSHVNSAGSRGRQNGRFPPHPHGRGGRGGYNGGGSRRPVGSGNVNVHVHVNGNFNGGGDWCGGQENRGGFNGQRRGRDHHQHGHRGPRHMPPGPQMGHAEPPQPYPVPVHPPSPQQPFMGMVPMPYYDAYYAYGPYGYPAEFAPGYYFPPPPEALPFVPYPAFPMHMMPPHWEQQQQAPQQPAQEQQQATPREKEQQDAPLTPEELYNLLRAQIEYYFSTDNLITDIYLRERMDEQGWVPLTVIAGFPRVKEQTTDMEVIVHSVLPSTEVEVKDGKIRRRTGWERYLLPKNN